MEIPFLDLTIKDEKIREEIISKITDVINSGRYILGKEVSQFEEEIAKYLDVEYAISCASGSDALFLSLLSLEIKPGDEVITTPFTFFSTASTIKRLGAKPVFVDITPKTFNIDEKLIEKAITSKTKAIIPVHLFGQTANMTEIMKIAKKHDLFVIEDACQAIGAKHNSKKAGTFGDLGCFSFFPTKNLGGFGDGGLIVTNNKSLAQYLRKARVHGSSKKYYHEFIGINSRLDAIQAAILRIKLKHLDNWNSKRRDIAKKYSKALMHSFQVPLIEKENLHVFHQYSLLAKDKLHREKIISNLKKENISSKIYYPLPLHLQPCFSELNYKEGDFPVSEEISKRIFSLPIYPTLSETKVKKIIGTIKNE